MLTAEIQYAYFQDLERSTKAGLVAYFSILIVGTIISIAGINTVYHFITHMKVCESLLITLLTINILSIFSRSLNKVSWLGEFHIWLDQKLFRFLFRSNEIILRELLLVLDTRERAIIDSLVTSEKTAIARSIFANLAENHSIFANLLRRGIFRSWILYWVLIYGVFAFVILTIASLSKSIIIPSAYGHAFFISIVTIGALHILLTIMQGMNILFTTKRLIRELIEFNHDEIVSLLRQQIKKT